MDTSDDNSRFRRRAMTVAMVTLCGMLLTVTACVPATSARQSSISGDDDCNSLPHSNFLPLQQLDFMCTHRRQWISDRDSQKGNGFEKTATSHQRQYISQLERCAVDECSAGSESDDKSLNEIEKKRRRKIRGSRWRAKSIRKEYRMLSPDERTRLHTAMNALKSRRVDNLTAWDLHTLVHYPDSATGAHWGPAFLPWHREFLRQFEVSLQREVSDVSLPYWDSTLDSGLPDPSDSVLWMDSMLGNGNGYVKTGPFADWNTNTLMPLSPVPVNNLYRSIGGRNEDRLLSERDVQWIEGRRNFSDLTFCHDKTFESMHGLSHVWVGGFMFVLRVSPNDPTFYMHHAFIDYLWERFRLKRQNRFQREHEYAAELCNSKHAFNAPMRPFNMKNSDGLSNKYTDEWYEYEAVRHCSETEPTCDSEYYFCDATAWRCRSKVQPGGNCTGFDGSDICYLSYCYKNVCRNWTVAKVDESEAKDGGRREVVFIKTALIEGQGSGITDTKAYIEVRDTHSGERFISYVQNSMEYPEFPGLAYLKAPKPRTGFPQKVLLEARDQYGRYCQAHCFNSTSDKYQVCQPELTLKTHADGSSNVSFSHSSTSRKFLDVDLSTHPSLVRVSAPNIVFACSRKIMRSDTIMGLTKSLRLPASTDEYVWTRVAIASRSDTANTSVATQVEVRDDTSGETWSVSVDSVRSAYDPTVLFIRLANPALHSDGVRVLVSLTNSVGSSVCNAKCLTSELVYQGCDGSLFIHVNDTLSDKEIFMADKSMLELLGWNMAGHPSLWTHRTPFLSFLC